MQLVLRPFQLLPLSCSLISSSISVSSCGNLKLKLYIPFHSASWSFSWVISVSCKLQETELKNSILNRIRIRIGASNLPPNAASRKVFYAPVSRGLGQCQVPSAKCHKNKKTHFQNWLVAKSTKIQKNIKWGQLELWWRLDAFCVAMWFGGGSDGSSLPAMIAHNIRIPVTSTQYQDDDVASLLLAINFCCQQNIDKQTLDWKPTKRIAQ